MIMKIHDFATMMALYPMTKTEDIAEEFGISVTKLRRMAKACHVKKSDDYRSEVARRNGQKKGKKVKK